MSQRIKDINGYITINSNPITREGVFPYLGKQIGAPIPDKIYNVYRPAEEINNEATIESFKLVPLVDDHTMLGNSEEGLTPAEEKGVHGSTGERVEFKDGVLYASLRIFSEKLSNLIKQGKKDLSLGYRCRYEKSDGTFAGKAYEYIQRSIRGNHLALVDQARCDVSVLDSHFAYDNLDLNIEKETIMDKEENKKVEADENKKGEDSVTLEGLAKTVDTLVKKVEDMTKKTEDEEKAKDEEAKKAEDEEEAKKDKEAADSMTDKEKLQAAMDKIDALEKADKERQETALDANDIRQNVMKEIAARDALAKNLSDHIGTFDCAEMSLDEVAKYGVEKIALDCEEGQELVTLKGYLKGAEATKVATDGTTTRKKESNFSFRDTMISDKK